MKSISFALLAAILFILIFSCKEKSNVSDTGNSTNTTDKYAGSVDPYFIETSDTSGIYGPTSITRNLLQDRHGNIWLATWEGILRYEGNKFINITNSEGLRRFHAFAIAVDSKGNMWFGTIGAGVYRYDGNSFTNFTSKDGLASDRIGCIYEDQTGKIWIGAEEGISIYDDGSIRNITTETGLTNNDVNSIIQDQTGKYWIGTRGPACTYDGKSFTQVRDDNDKPFINVRIIIEDSRGDIWLGGNDGLNRLQGNRFSNIAPEFTGYIYEDQQGNIWTNSEAPADRQSWVLSRYDHISLDAGQPVATSILKKEGMFFGITEDSQGNIWFGSLDGACRFDGVGFEWFRK